MCWEDRMQKSRKLMIGAAIALSLVTTAQAADGPEIGAILSLTGVAAAVGNQQKHGIELAVEDINASGGIDGKPLTVYFEDHQAKPDQAVLAFNRLTELHAVPAIISGFSGPTLAIAPLANRKKTLLINPSAQADQWGKASPYLVNTIPTVENETTVLAKYVFEKLGKKTASILYENSAPGISGRDDFKAAFEKEGGKILDEEPVQFGETNFRPSLLKIAAGKPDAVFGQITQGTPLLAEQAKQLNTTFTIVGTSNFIEPALQGNQNANGWYHTQLLNSVPAGVEDKFKAKYGESMNFHAKQCFNATEILAASMRKVVKDGGSLDGASVKKALFDIGTFGTSEMPIVFKTNTAEMGIGINEFKDGVSTMIEKESTAN
jgi:branched-chain amino acid transport system substrate-binding protein